MTEGLEWVPVNADYWRLRGLNPTTVRAVLYRENGLWWLHGSLGRLTAHNRLREAAEAAKKLLTPREVERLRERAYECWFRSIIRHG